MRKYYEANPNAIKNKHLLALHEALHATVCEALGDTWHKIVLRKATGFVNWTQMLKGWKRVAMEMAPALVDDMSVSDYDNIKKYPPRTRGYAWGWLRSNREALMTRANEIAAATDGRGTLWNNDGKLMWKSKEKK